MRYDYIITPKLVQCYITAPVKKKYQSCQQEYIIVYTFTGLGCLAYNSIYWYILVYDVTKSIYQYIPVYTYIYFIYYGTGFQMHLRFKVARKIHFNPSLEQKKYECFANCELRKVSSELRAKCILKHSFVIWGDLCCSGAICGASRSSRKCTDPLLQRKHGTGRSTTAFTPACTPV